jgi:glucose dehydrogenase
MVNRMLFQTGTSKLGSLETTPLVVDGTMYVTTPYSEAIIAYDLRTNKQLWRQEPKIGTTITCCGPVNRGVAVGGGTVFVGTLDARLLAFDARTGKPKWDVEVADPTFGYSITMAPLIVGEHVIVGVSGGEYGIRGHLDAYDMATGKQVWRWYSIPAPGDDPVATNGWWGTWATHAEDADLHRDIAREKADSTKYADAWKTGGGGVWTTPSYDKASNTIYATVGNPSPDLDGSVRPGDNLFTDGIVAIDATTGKTGWLYAVDAATGKLVRKSQNFVPHENMFALPTAKGTRMLPGANGGSEWSPISVNPKLGYAFVAALHQPMNYITHTAPWEKGRLWLGSAFVAIPGEEQYGLFSAIDLKTGKIAWQNKVPQPMMGGSLSTAGGLTFTGEGNGNFNAYDSKTGKLLWQFNAGAGCNGTPMSFELDKEQFIGMACGGNFQLSYPLGAAILIFGLPKAPAGR